MGPDSNSFGGLSPVNPAVTLRYATNEASADFDNLLSDTESLTADVWTILCIEDRCRNQKLLQFKITNNSGGSSDIESAFLRVVPC